MNLIKLLAGIMILISSQAALALQQDPAFNHLNDSAQETYDLINEAPRLVWMATPELLNIIKKEQGTELDNQYGNSVRIQLVGVVEKSNKNLRCERQKFLIMTEQSFGSNVSYSQYTYRCYPLK